MRSAITISLVPQARGGPFVFWDGLEAGCATAAELGFDAVEIFAPDAGALDTNALRELLTRHGLQLAALGTGGGWVVHRWSLTDPDEEIRSKAREFIRRIIDCAGSFGAPAIIGSMQGRWDAGAGREACLEWMAEALEDLGAHAAGCGAVLLYEPLNRYETNFFTRLEDTSTWLKSLPAANVRILADLFHMNIEEADLAAALQAAGGLVGHVHFADSNRRAVGFGHTAIPPIIAALRATGYEGYLSAEILPLPDSMSAARQTISAFRAALA